MWNIYLYLVWQVILMTVYVTLMGSFKEDFVKEVNAKYKMLKPLF